MTTTTTTRRQREESGQMAIMICGFFLIIVLLIAVVTDSSAAYLQRSGLNTVADGAALAGADAIDENPFYTGSKSPPLDPEAADKRIIDYLTSTKAGERFPGL
jgi:hypothetical protein